jgi:hypothetical protein
MNITTLKSELEGILHGTTLNKVSNIDRVIDRAARQLLLDVDPQETIRMTQLDPIYDEVYNYPCPTDLKGIAILDIRPQVQRTMRDRYTQTYSQEFDINKAYTLQPNFNIQYNTGLRTLQVDSPLLNTGIILNQVGSLTGNGTWSGTASDLAIDNVNFAAGSGALTFNLSATGQYVEDTMPTPIDLTSHYNQSTLFFWVYLPIAANFTSVSLRWGSSSSDYWSSANIAVTQENTVFQNGWNLIAVDWTAATVTGTPDQTDVDYVRVTFNTSGGAQTGVKLNQIVSRLGEIVQVLYYSKYMFRDAVTGAFQETVTDNGNLINLDTETYNLLLNLVALYCIQQVFDDKSSKDLVFYTNEYNKSLKRYQALYKSQRNKPKVQYYRKPGPNFRKYWGRGWNY